ncbi:hypothetical protein ES703_78872 [subsurface metagenome]
MVLRGRLGRGICRILLTTSLMVTIAPTAPKRVQSYSSGTLQLISPRSMPMESWLNLPRESPSRQTPAWIGISELERKKRRPLRSPRPRLRVAPIRIRLDFSWISSRSSSVGRVTITATPRELSPTPGPMTRSGCRVMV